jgi:hypothetical protein
MLIQEFSVNGSTTASNPVGVGSSPTTLANGQVLNVGSESSLQN